ncbi:Glutamate racemase [Leptospira interrogans serovar Manilae]|uniref:Glutamate racemase n=1 Tax=Leptospira interrogans serovar Manilae TaxID=214675 RepID=A0AAQ1P056_LEPIR|nr:glutamate racemase [Leptospira interrogans]AKP25362.1 glutamate racemase [Leptospira interrogans serovar Manilae]AKP29146.1 glutamate racemase [Leptospira interrogans serovar Manilae]EYU65073.1 glutamate racemase [Leptospira interrogans serovar Manilae]SOR61903.1 Glutamate racemase [Leptospira interrogans serovar Manilae]
MKGKFKIGLMDSGMGGLSVLKELLKQNAGLEIVYYGDLKNSPYGEKNASEVLELVRSVCNFLQKENVNAILLACNTATSAAAQTLRKEFSIPIFGMEPAIKPAILQNPGKKVALLATPVTQREEKLQRLKSELKAEELVLSISCPGLAGLVDQGDFDKAEKYLRPILTNLQEQDVENLVLGCTHYVFLKQIILKNFPNVKIYDGNSGTIKHLLNSLQVPRVILNGSQNNRSIYKLILNSEKEFHFRLASELLSLKE